MKFFPTGSNRRDEEIIARFIDGDPIMARQIKEHISEKRLIECLEITIPTRIEIVKSVETQRCLLLTTERVVETFTFQEICAAYFKKWRSK